MSRRKPFSKEAYDRWDRFSRLSHPLLKVLGDLERGTATVADFRSAFHVFYEQVNDIIFGTADAGTTKGKATLTLHHNEWQILTVLAAEPKVAMVQADIGENTNPKLSPQSVSRWVKKTRKRGLTKPLESGGECITAKGLSLMMGK